MKLVIATPSPFARKVRVVLREKEIDFEEIIDVPWNRDTICTKYNPLGKIPVLLREGKQPLFDSSIIVQHIECMNKPPAMYPSGLEDAMLAKIIETTADGICDALVLISLENTRKEKLRSKDWIKRQSEKIYNGIEYLSNKLGNEIYFVGGEFTIADVAGFSCLEYLDLRFPNFEWRGKHPNLAFYWQTHKNRRSFFDTRPTAQVIETIDN